MGDSWRFHGVHKWIAYDRVSGEVVGRGGLSRTPVDDDWGQIYAFLPAEPWSASRMRFAAHSLRTRTGWRSDGRYDASSGGGYASEIGCAGLAFAFDAIGVQAVVSCTVRHNVRSRAVMERIGMRYAGEIRSRGMVEEVKGEQDDAPFANSRCHDRGRGIRACGWDCRDRQSGSSSHDASHWPAAWWTRPPSTPASCSSVRANVSQRRRSTFGPDASTRPLAIIVKRNWYQT